MSLCAAMLCGGLASGCRPAPTTSAASGDTPTVEDATPDAAAGADAPADAGAPCLSADGCASGVCEGQGCGDDTPGACAANDRMCTRDARQYCGCDGETFVGSGSCPGQRYASAGPCEGDAGLGAATPPS